jgi:hypothetical protein
MSLECYPTSWLSLSDASRNAIATQHADVCIMETADVLQSVEIVTSSGDWCILSKEREELAYSYRTSPFQKMKHVAAIVAATFQLTPCPNARQRQKLFLDRYLPSTFCYACYRLRNCNSAPDIPCCTTHSRLV